MGQKKFCWNCGEPLGDSGKFCPKCGAAINREIKPEQKDLQKENSVKLTAQKGIKENTVTRTVPQKKSKKGMLLVAVIAILIIAVVVAIKFSGSTNGQAELSEYLWGRDPINTFIKENKYKETLNNYYESPDGQVAIQLYEDGSPKSAVISGGDTTIYGIGIGDTFSVESTGRKLTSNGFGYQAEDAGSVTYIAEFPNGYKEIQIFINSDKNQIDSVMYSVYLSGEAENTEKDTFQDSSGTNRTKEELSIDESIVSSERDVPVDTIFAESTKMCSWKSDSTGYYMIPFYDSESKTYQIWFTIANDTVWADTVYTVNVSEMERTESGGIICRGKMMFATKSGDEENGTVEITWNSLETVDYPTIKMIDGHQFTEVDMIADDYSYYGPVSDGYSSDIYDTSEYILPDVDKRYYTKEELALLPKEMLRLARNEVFARHHRKYETQDLKEYFEAQSWYQGNLSAEEFDDSVLNEYEKGNLDLIKAIERGGMASFEADWIYGTYECHDGVDAEAEIGWYSDSGNEYISLLGASKDGKGVGEFIGEVISTKGGNYTAVDEFGNVIDFFYNGIDAIEISNGGNMGGASFPGFNGVYYKVKDLPHNVN